MTGDATNTILCPDWFEVAGFKALSSPARVHFRPLTVLAGANSSGKSSIMQPLLMMKQTLESPHDPGPLLLDGPHVRFTEPEQFLSRGAGTSSARSLEFTLGPLLRPTSGKYPPVRLSFTPGVPGRDFGLAHSTASIPVDDRWVRLDTSISPADFVSVLSSWSGNPLRDLPPATLRFVVEPERIVDSIVLQAATHQDILSPWVGRGISVLETNSEWLSYLLHLPGLRGHRERRYAAPRVGTTPVGIRVEGPFTPYAASLIAQWSDGQDARLEEVNDSLRRLGLTWKVQARRVSAAAIELRVGRTPKRQQGGANDLVHIADVGFGVSQVLPVVVALAAATPGQMVYVEQPELHLHPRAQLHMGRLLAEAAFRGVRVVVETHSRMILRAIQTEVASPGGLTSDSVGLHWFQQDPRTGFSTVVLAEVDSSGAFGEWPIDFSDVESDADSSWMDAAFGATA